MLFIKYPKVSAGICLMKTAFLLSTHPGYGRELKSSLNIFWILVHAVDAMMLFSSAELQTVDTTKLRCYLLKWEGQPALLNSGSFLPKKGNTIKNLKVPQCICFNLGTAL